MYLFIACRDNDFQCKNTGRCIPGFAVCDGFNGCGDWSDEENCSELFLQLFICILVNHRTLDDLDMT